MKLHRSCFLVVFLIAASLISESGVSAQPHPDPVQQWINPADGKSVSWDESWQIDANETLIPSYAPNSRSALHLVTPQGHGKLTIVIVPKDEESSNPDFWANLWTGNNYRPVPDAQIPAMIIHYSRTAEVASVALRFQDAAGNDTIAAYEACVNSDGSITIMELVANPDDFLAVHDMGADAISVDGVPLPILWSHEWILLQPRSVVAAYD